MISVLCALNPMMLLNEKNNPVTGYAPQCFLRPINKVYNRRDIFGKNAEQGMLENRIPFKMKTAMAISFYGVDTVIVPLGNANVNPYCRIEKTFFITY